MTQIVICTYDSAHKVKSTREDLLANGIPEEQIYVEEDNNLIKLMIPDVIRPEVMKILNRHNPTQVV